MTKLRDKLPTLTFWLLGLLMLWQIPKMTDLHPLTRLTVPMAAALAAFGLGAMLLRGMWKQLPSLLLMGCLCWAGVCSLLRGSLFADLYSYVPAACAMLFCWQAGYCEDENQLRRTVRMVCGMWISWMTVLSAVALVAALGGFHLRQTAVNRFIGINEGDHRLYIMDYCTNAAGNLVAAILMAVCVILHTKKPILRYGCMAALVLLVGALSLTDARTSFISCGVGIGAIAACQLFHRSSVKGVLRYVVALAAAAVTAGLVYLLIGAVTNLLGTLVPGSLRSVLPAALADEAGVAHRSLDNGNLLTYRDDVWRGVLSFLKAEPRYLLTGTGPSQLMEKVSPYVVSKLAQFDHPHCIFLHLLGSYGIPVLGAAVVFLALFARSALRLLFTRDCEMWLRLLPVPAIAVMVSELVECLTLGRVNGPILILLFLCFGAVFAADRMTGERNRHAA